jgi:hypothetical protein
MAGRRSVLSDEDHAEQQKSIAEVAADTTAGVSCLSNSQDLRIEKSRF